ncbi:MAG: shikimate dehydrogenase [Methanocorpusculum sp.]|nr:shikimate dehydrogenase [Methanocorpusculum sp.]MDE2522991.1 shikimate dehydrogenase [Methanocorpusculum sp.]MDE2524254.1 shikimate dehydrogenase [Methanocorpusculum sp.]
MTLICAVIAADTPASAEAMAAEALAAGAEAFEVRLDAFAEIPDDLSFLPTEKPVIVTFRSEEDENRREIFAKALACGAAYVDIESDSVLRNIFPKTRVICSYHDFAKTPAAWEILHLFRDLSTSGIPKAAFMVRGPADLLEIWKAAVVLKQSGEPFILIGMGAAGEITRIRAADIGSIVSYCAVRPELTSAPGQITVAEAAGLGTDPFITAITGWPLEHTRSPQMHNAAFRAAGIPGRYVRIPAPAEELPLLPEVLRCYQIRGANVTIPHKQAVMPLLSEVSPAAQSAGAVNTILVSRDGRLIGTNTDIAGIAATVAALHITPSGARVLVAGAGGAARAAVACLTAAGAAVFITNRTMKKAESLAAEFGATAVPREELKAGYDLIINATPAGMSGFPAGIPIPESILTPQTAVFDMVYEPETTPLIAAARAAGCRAVLGGKTMLIAQAAASFTLWTGTAADIATMTAAFGGGK